MEEIIEIKSKVSKEETTTKRIHLFRYHLAAFFLCILLLTTLKFLINIADIWFVFFLLGWGGVLALHVAYVMGLLDVLKLDQ